MLDARRGMSERGSYDEGKGDGKCAEKRRGETEGRAFIESR